jgi:hypothetical protein
MNVEGWRSLRILAAETDATLNALAIEAFNDLLKKHGKKQTVGNPLAGQTRRIGLAESPVVHWADRRRSGFGCCSSRLMSKHPRSIQFRRWARLGVAVALTVADHNRSENVV